MARPQKQGLDYFSLDVKMNDEAEIIEAEHGLVGFAILIKLFQKIYSEGYFYEWGDKEQILFSGKVSVDRNLVTTIVNDCIKWSIFDQKMYEKYNILTSRRIQNQYFTAVYRRVGVEVVEEYLLVDVSDKANLLTVTVSDDRNSATTIVNDSENEDVTNVSDVKSTQSKVKESKVNKSKEKNYDGDSLMQIKNLRSRYSEEQLKIIDNYLDILRWTRKHGKIADSVILKIYQEWEKFNPVVVIYALEVYVNNPKHHDKKENYCYGIMRNTTMEEIESKKQGNVKQAQIQQPPKTKTKFHLAKSRGDKYSAEELEQLILSNQKNRRI